MNNFSCFINEGNCSLIAYCANWGRLVEIHNVDEGEINGV